MIGRPTIKKLEGVSDSPAEVVHLHYKGQTAVLQLSPEYTRPRVEADSMDSEDSISDSELNESGDGV